MKYLLNTINSKLNTLNLSIEDILNEELLLLLQQIKVGFKTNSEDVDQYINKLSDLYNLKNSISNHLNSYKFTTEGIEKLENNKNNDRDKKHEDYKKDIETSKNNKEFDVDSEKNNALSVSSNTVEEVTQENFEKRLSKIDGVTDDTYYFYRFNENYGEENNKLTLSYDFKPLDQFDLFSIKISGLKLFDNVFFGRTINESITKLFSFLFILNEKPFITLCAQNSKYFAKYPSSMKRPITLKNNMCYYESNLTESEAAEMLKLFLDHINVNISACKVLLDCNTSKPEESFITFVL